MTRADVRGLLGAPQVSSTYWGFDLFRAETEQTEVVFAVTPWPVPFWGFRDRLQRYTLIAYDPSGLAAAVASGVFRKRSKGGGIPSIRDDFPSLHLRAGELMFSVDPEGAREPGLLVSPRGRGPFLRDAHSSKGCTTVLGCGDRGCGDQLSVDGGPVRKLPVRAVHKYWLRDGERDSWLEGVDPQGRDSQTPWLETLVALQIAAGEHLLEFSAKHLGGRASLKLACRAGEVTYLVISASDNKKFLSPALVDWRIDRRETMPECFAGRPLVLLHDGGWQVEFDENEERRGKTRLPDPPVGGGP
jgi:hypothetical protein